MSQAGEPSVEEILESIKKVIARDSRTNANEESRLRRSRDVTEPAPAGPEENILELAESAEVPPAAAPLIAEDARSSISDSLAALAMLSEPPAAPRLVRSGETSLEDMARDLLRPALAEWLDRNLPAIVERMVAAEIARIVGKKG